MRSGWLVYKCRRCDAIEWKIGVPNVIDTLATIQVRGQAGDIDTTGRVARPTGIHLCSGTVGKDARYGIMDLIGGNEGE